jgi:prepilin-type N-terminal cleavage/methylation domain-containing protein
MIQILATQKLPSPPRSERSGGNQAGFSLTEVLVSMLLASIVALSLSKGTSVGYTILSDSRRTASARQIAASKVEELTLSDPATLSAQSYTESVTQNGYTFSRTVTIALNSDGSASVTVSASSGGSGAPALATVTARLTSWSSS